MGPSVDAGRARSDRDPHSACLEASQSASQHESFEARLVRERESRLRAIFGLGANRRLPKVHAGSLLTYFEHLAPRIQFPFKAEYCEEGKPGKQSVVVLGLIDPRKSRPDPLAGLLCVVRLGERKFAAPLVDLEMAHDHPDFQLLEDYWYWVWNWQI